MIYNPFSIKSKNIVITGASSGIGEKCAIVFSKMGANVILIARRADKLDQVYKQLSPGPHLKFIFDVRDFEDIEDLIKKVVLKIGLINGFVHSAGIDLTLPLSALKPKHYQEIFSTNVIAGFELSKVLSNHKYISKKGGSFVIISSIMGVLGNPGKIAYCASKGSVIAGVKAMALELAEKNIRVNTISPAIVETEMVKKLFETIPKESVKSIVGMHPLGLGSAEDIAFACAYLISDASKWITGTNLIIDGGYSAK